MICTGTGFFIDTSIYCLFDFERRQLMQRRTKTLRRRRKRSPDPQLPLRYSPGKDTFRGIKQQSAGGDTGARTPSSPSVTLQVRIRSKGLSNKQQSAGGDTGARTPSSPSVTFQVRILSGGLSSNRDTGARTPPPLLALRYSPGK
jgi:hypothetical protein